MNMTRKQKRSLDQEINHFSDLLLIIKHYFPQLFKKMNRINDPRHTSYIHYKQSDLMMTRILGFLSNCESMNQLNWVMNHETVINNLKVLCGQHIEDAPHGDTINNYLEEVYHQSLRDLLTYMFKSLLDKRMLDSYRIQNKYYQVIIDGTQLYNYSKPHVKNSLVTVHSDGTTRYHTNILLAIVTMGKIVIPIDFEIIDNEVTNTSKQDCEINAAKRLLERIKRHYKRLAICLSGDGLYFSEPMLEVCKKYRWQYMITYKEGCARSVQEYYDTAKKYDDIKKYTTKEKEYEYYNGIEYRDYKVNLMKMNTEKKGKVTTFTYATSIRITEGNVEKMIEHGRRRWQIENQGFNTMKHHGFQLTHAYSYNSNAIQGHFALMLISHILMQLLRYYEETKGRSYSYKELKEKIKETLRYSTLSVQNVREIFALKQIRLNL